MQLSTHHVLDWFAAKRATPEMKRMMLSIGILNFAVGSISLYEPIYLFNLGYSLRDILLFYGAMYVIYITLLPFAASISRRWGLHHAMLYSGPFLIAYYLLLMGAGAHPWFLVLAVPVYAMQKMLYWPNYHSALAECGSGHERGKELSELYVLMQVVAVFGPIFGGLVIAGLGFGSLFAIAAVLILISYAPLMSMPDRQDGDDYQISGVYKRIFDKTRWRQTLAWLAYGEELISMTAWPIAVILVAGGFVEAGVAISASLVALMALTLVAGRFTDKNNRAVTRAGGLLTLVSWLIKPFALSAPLVSAIDAFYRFSRNALDVPVFTATYEQAKAGSVREEIVVMEVCYCTGKMLAAALGIVLLTFTHGNFTTLADFTPLFMLAAAFSLFSFLR